MTATVMVDSGKAVKVRMLFFGPLAESMGQREVEVALELGTTAEQLIERFDLSKHLESGLRVAIDGLPQPDDRTLIAGSFPLVFPLIWR